jgi:hypothetical protein
MGKKKYLSNSQLRLAVAKALGYKRRTGGGWWTPTWWKGLPGGMVDELPAFEADLNACRAFEHDLGFHDAGSAPSPWKRAYEYWRQLQNVQPDRLYASARQRCEALLAALEKVPLA